MRSGRAVACLVAVVVMGPVNPVCASLPDGFNHPELHWLELRTPHFRVIYHEGLDETANLVATLAEGNYERVCQSIGAYPTSATPIILSDHSTQTREYAARFKHSIWLVGNTINDARLDKATWLNLVVHEFAHVCTYYKLRAGPVPSAWEWFASPMLPGWLYEGLAESESNRYSQLGYSVLRSAVLEDNLPPLAALDTEADRTLMDMWLKYAAGQSLVAYMTELGGPDVVPRLLSEYRDAPYFHWAVRDVFDMGYDDLYREWKEYIRAYYSPLLEGHVAVDSHSTTVDLGVEFIRSARVSPDGSRIAFLGIKDDQEPVMQLFVADRDGANRVIVSSDTDLYKSVAISWSPDSRKLAYGRHWSTSDGRVRLGIYVYDVENRSSERISGDLNAADPAWSPSGEEIAVVVFDQDSGASRLALLGPDGSGLRVLTDGPEMPSNVFRPCWSPDGTALCVEVVHWGTVNLATMGADGRNLRMLTDEAHGYNRSPDWSPDGTRIAFCHSTGPAPQVCVYDLQDEALLPITSEMVRTMQDPSFAPDGTLLCPAWGSRYSDLRIMEPRPLAGPEPMPRPPGEGYVPCFARADTLAERYPELDPAGWERRSYSSWDAVRVFLVRPHSVTDPYGQQPALRLFAQDPLEQHTVAAEVSLTRQTGDVGYGLEYVNSEHRGDVFGRVRRRLAGPKPIGEDLSVLDAETAYLIGARWMRNPTPSPYTRDSYGVGIVHNHFDAAGGSGRTIAQPQSTTYVEASWERYALRPTHGNWTARLIGRASIPQLSCRSELYDALAEFRWNRTWSGTRRELSLALDGRAALFSDRSGARYQGTYLLPSVAYRWRLSDYAWTSAWPFVWLDTIDLTLSADCYLPRGTSLLVRYPGLALCAQLVGKGHITHGLPYTLTLAAEYRPQAPQSDRTRLTLTFTTDADSVFGF